ncbi:D-arabinono-1,4-lactone oxidase [Williamsia deligens]|uniref:D-arabinono-1,4-lactone oxidase n=1 Tax=Williamsia deligens TaxID=321325 RepID=A0ABW3G3A5_9NOCA|nr:D-arabinono-1,4-lactone oxidase [Williamsia deligens]
MTTIRTAPATTSGTRWRNWGRTQAATPSDVVTVREVDDVVTAVRRARTAGTTVKAAGSGHSFSGIAVPTGTSVDLSAMSGLVTADPDRGRVTVRAGTPLHQMPGILEPLGLAMPNLGDVDAQTLAGATSTGTHGTGLGVGGIATQIVGLTLVTGTGEMLTVGEDDPDLLQATALGLGALGVLVDITLQCVPAFALEAVERAVSVDAAISGFLDAVRTSDHHEFYWFPHTDVALTKTNTRLPADTPAQGPGRVARFVSDELLSNGVFAVMCEAGARFPAVTPALARVAGAAQSGRRFVASSPDVFVSARRVRFREMEYAIPLAQVPEAVDEIRALIDRRGWRISFPLEVRAAPADELMLSTASGRDSGYIAVHRYFRDAPDDYFTSVEEILARRGGRPHWGKMHTRTADDLRSVYPRFDEFVAARDRLDPDRVFANPYLTSVLGR